MNREPIAIVGMACLLPDAPNLASYWRNIVAARDAISDLPEDHSWTAEDQFHADPSTPDKTYCRRGGFLPKIPFDPMAFGLPPNALDATDTSQLLGLIVAREALKDAGINPDGDGWAKERTSCILGVTGTQELAISLGSRLQGPTWKRAMVRCGVDAQLADRVVADIGKFFPEWQELSFPGLLGNVVSGRIANRLDLGGTNCVVDAACASSLAAIELAVSELQSGKSDLALSGGVDTLNDIFMYMCFSKTPALSKSGDIRPFAADGDGTLISEGLAITVLKRLSDAQRDNDRIYAVIRGIGTSSDGRYKSIYAPNPKGQSLAIRRAYEEAQFPVETIELIEAHGTGTKAGDAAEIEGLKAVFSNSSRDGRHVAIGSVKSQIGHTKSTAGAAGLVKTALALYHRVLPPMAKINGPNPRLGLESSKLYLNTMARPWIHSGPTPRRAGVSAFGFGGSNFHMALEEYGDDQQIQALNLAEEQLFLIGAADVAGLTAAIKEIPLESSLIACSRFVCERWQPSAQVLGFTASSKEALIACLAVAQTLLSNGPGEKDGVVYAIPHRHPIAILFPGQGSQYVNMARVLAVQYPSVRATFDRVEAHFQTAGRGSISDVIFPPPALEATEAQVAQQKLTATEWAQPSIGATSVAMLELLRRFGVLADAYAGHSYGELVALYAAGAISEETLWTLSRVRGEAMADQGVDRGTMAAVAGELDRIQEALNGLSDGVVLANKNHPKQGVISGSRVGITNALEALTKAGFAAKEIQVSAAFHSPLVADAREPFKKALSKADFSAPKAPVYANVTGKPYPTGVKAARELLGNQITSPVDFVGIVRGLLEQGVRTFIECGPKGVLSGLLRHNLKGHSDIAIIGLDREGAEVDGDIQWKRALIALASRGLPLDLRPILEILPPPEPRQAGSLATVWLSGANFRKPETRSPIAPVLPKISIAAEPSPKPALPSLTASLPPGKSVQPRVSITPPAAVEAKLPMPARPTPSNVVPVAKGTKKQAAFSPPVRVSSLPTPSPLPVLNHGAFMSDSRKPSADPSTLLALVESTRQGLMAFQEAQERTASVHAEYLRSVAKANESFATLFGAHARLVEDASGMPASSSPATPSRTPKLSTAESNVETPRLLERLRLPRLPLQKLVQKNVSTLQDLRGDVLGKLGQWWGGLRAGTVDTNVQSSTLNPYANSAQFEEHGRIRTTVASRPQIAEEEDIPEILTSNAAGRIVSRPSMPKPAAPAPRMATPKAPTAAPRMAAPPPTPRTLPTPAPRVAAAPPSRAPAPRAPAPTPRVAAPPVRTAPPKASPPATGRQAIVDAMLATVAEKTGYPKEMLELSMDLESDLGIDSIKRVEILSAVQERIAGLPELDNEQMASLRTVGEVVDFLVVSLGDTAPAAPARSVESAPHRLQSAPERHRGLDTPPAQGLHRSAIVDAMLATVAEKTGYPKEMLELGMDLESDLGIDSIKRVEILSAVQERIAGLPELDNEQMASLRTVGEVVDFLAASLGSSESVLKECPAPIALEPTDRSSIVDAMLTTVAEKTGYPKEMLELSMDLESDLGIDSIKRVEILSAVQERISGLPELDNETMASLRTVGEVVDFLAASLGDVTDAPRREVELESAPPGHRRLLPRRLVLTDDRVGWASELEKRLRGAGIEVHRIAPDWADPDAIRAAVPNDVDGLIHLAAVGETGTALRARVEGAIWLAQGLGSKQLFLAVTSAGGLFGGDPWFGGLAGLVKTLAQEWEHTCCRLIDMEPGLSIDALWNELGIERKVVEVALTSNGPRSPRVVERVLPRRVGPAIAPGEGVVITGGARGVTAAVAIELAKRWRPALLLLGRSTVFEQDPLWAESVPAERLKAAALANFQASGHKPTPKVLNAAVADVIAAREVRNTVFTIQSLDVEVKYAAVDVRDPASVKAAFKAFQHPIRGIVHGAGVLADKRIEDKTPAMTASVIGTKIDGLAAVLQSVDVESLAFVALFGSVAGRFGNRGQCDYAMANEVLSRTAVQLSSRGIPRVRCFAWGPWEGGMVTPELKKQMAARGMSMIPLEAGAGWCIDELETDGPAEVIYGGPEHGGPLVGETAKQPSLKEHGEVVYALSSNDPGLRDHRLAGRTVLPAVWVLDAMYSVASSVLAKPMVIRDFQVLKGVAFDNSTEVILKWHRIAPHRLTFVLEGTNSTLFYRGTAEVVNEEIPPRFKPDATFTRKPYPLRIDEAYRTRLFHGPGLHGITRFEGMSERGSVARLADPTGTDHPTSLVILDSILQQMVLWVRETRSAAALPTGIGLYRQYAPFPQEVISTVEMLPTSTANGRFHATLTDRDGRVVAVLKDGSYTANAAMNEQFRILEV